jgi:hypothetical protein
MRLVLGVKGKGQPQWHVAADPFPAETQVRGFRVTAWGVNLHAVQAVCSVACLECGG